MGSNHQCAPVGFSLCWLDAHKHCNALRSCRPKFLPPPEYLPTSTCNASKCTQGAVICISSITLHTKTVQCTAVLYDKRDSCLTNFCGGHIHHAMVAQVALPATVCISCVMRILFDECQGLQVVQRVGLPALALHPPC